MDCFERSGKDALNAPFVDTTSYAFVFIELHLSVFIVFSLIYLLT